MSKTTFFIMLIGIVVALGSAIIQDERIFAMVYCIGMCVALFGFLMKVKEEVTIEMGEKGGAK